MAQIAASGVRQVGLRGVKTASSVCIRSAKPPVQGQQYLDLYVLQRDRARWGQLKVRAEQMIHSIDKALARLGLNADYLGRLDGANGQTRAGGGPARRPAIIARDRSRLPAGRKAVRRGTEKVA